MLTREKSRLKRHSSIRRRMIGSPERPRLCVHRSLNNLYVQVVDDTKGCTLISFSTRDTSFQKSLKGNANKKDLAQKLGQFFAPQLKAKGIAQIAFDRGGYQYHGRIKALADALREGGIQF